MKTRIVKLKLNQALGSYYASEDYNEVVNNSLNFLDIVYTYFFRYPWLLDEIQGYIDSRGPLLDYMSSHPLAAVTLTLLLAGAAANLARDKYLEQQKAKEGQVNQYQNTNQLIREGLASHDLEGCSRRDAINNCFQKLLISNRKLRKKYKSIQVNDQGELELKQEEMECDLEIYYSGEPKEDEVKANKIYLYYVNDRLKYKAIKANGEVSDFIIDENKHEMGEYLQSIKEALKEGRELSTEERDALFEEAVIEGYLQKPSFGSWFRSKLSSFVYDTWVTLGLSAFVYWILWIGAGIITGHFGSGIDGLGTAAFIVPLSVGGAYPLLKLRHWWKYHGVSQNDGSVEIVEDSEIILSALTDASKLAKHAILMNEKDRLKTELEKLGVSVRPQTSKPLGSFDGDEQIKELGQNASIRAAATFVLTTVSTFSGAQYVAWILTEALKAVFGVSLIAPGFALGFGMAFIIASVAYGVYRAYQHYQKLEEYRSQVESLSQKDFVIRQDCELKRKAIQRLILKIEDRSHDLSDLVWLAKERKAIHAANIKTPLAVQGLRANTEETGLGLLTFLSGATTGVMIVRIIAVGGTATFLPFAALVLGNVATISLLVVGGLAYGFFRWHQSCQQEKEGQASQFLQERKLLEERSEVDDSEIRLLELKLKELEKKASPVKKKTSQDDRFISLASSHRLLQQSLFKIRILDDLDQPRNVSPIIAAGNN